MKQVLLVVFLLIGMTNIPSYSQIFTRITEGAIVNDSSRSFGCSWTDYDNDGDFDVFLSVFTNYNNILYRNNGDGTFNRINTGDIVTNGGQSLGASWGDYDNDGDEDLYVANYLSSQDNFLYRNDGNEDFTRILTGPVVQDSGSTYSATWGDYDNDGKLDLFLANDWGENNVLFHNEGNGGFTRIRSGDIVNNGGSSLGATWADYDNDGDLDLFVANWNYQQNFLYQNNGNSSFTRILTGNIANDYGSSTGGSWGDYDNDGDLDLFVANDNYENNFLYRNNGDGTFFKVTTGALVTDGGKSVGSTWGDYDNDGDLDLFVANIGHYNFLYENDGQGNFTKITTGDIVSVIGQSRGSSWIDYDNDGDIDLYVANDLFDNNFLFRNNGNSNHWLHVKCIGIVSNRSAIGTKIRIKATIGSTPTWQMRELSGQTGVYSQGPNLAMFGLGQATVVDSVIVEWPSGIRQVLTQVPVNQKLTLTEVVSDTVRLELGHGYTFHGRKGTMELRLTNSTAVTGLQFDLTPDPADALTIDSIHLTGRAGEMEVIYNDDTRKALIFSSVQNSIDTGHDAIASVFYTVTPSAPLFDTISLSLVSAYASAVGNQPLFVETHAGSVLAARKGDVNLDSVINVLDVQETARLIVGLPVVTEPGIEDKMEIADVETPPHGDGLVNLFDLNTIIDWSLGHEGTGKTHRPFVDLDSMTVYLNSTVDIGGIQFDVADADLESVQLAPAMGHMQLARRNGRIIIYSPAGEVIPAGYRAVATLYFAKGDHPAFTGVIAGNTSGQGMFTASKDGTLIIDEIVINEDRPRVPTEISLRQNYPNPFNPQTTIRYELTEQARVTLAIYNSLGQEVVTLVNTTLGPGYHVAEWNGRDRLGRQVSSGVYLYRLQIGTKVFSKKMMLLK